MGITVFAHAVVSLIIIGIRIEYKLSGFKSEVQRRYDESVAVS